MVYFIQQGTDGPIKIGQSTSPKARLKELQCAHAEDLHMLAVVTGGRKLERELHGRFAHGRLRGEWFRSDTLGLSEYIAQVATDPEPPVMCVACRRAPVGRRRKRYCDYCGGVKDGQIPPDEERDAENLRIAMDEMVRSGAWA